MSKRNNKAALPAVPVMVPVVAPAMQAATASAAPQPTESPVAVPVAVPAAESAKKPVGTGLKIQKDRPEANGVKVRSAGGKCAAVWAYCDANKGATVGQVKAWAEAEGFNVNNASIEFYCWRKFNGIKGRTPKAAPAPTVEMTTADL